MSNYVPSSKAGTYDPLVTYDTESIGKEFSTSGRIQTQSREHEARRSMLAVNSWKETLSLSDSQRIPKSSLKNMCNYDTHRANVHSVVSVTVFVVLASIAGVVVAMLIRQLNL